MDEVPPAIALREMLSGELTALAEQEMRLHSLLIAAGRQLADRQRDIEACVEEVRARARAPQASDADGPRTHHAGDDGQGPGHLPYQALLKKIREIAAGATRPGATVLVVSRGDPQLVQLENRTAWHFPRDDAGVYAGYHPADSAAAIAHLEVLRGRGAEYLLFPSTAFWWLDYYTELAEHLETHCYRSWRDEHCAIYDLAARAAAPKPEPRTGTTNWLADLVLGG